MEVNTRQAKAEHGLPFVSLFSGAMGLDMGLERAGFETRVCVENDLACTQTIQANRPMLSVLGDITGVSGDAILKAAGLRHGQAVLVAGGPPCQSFSTAGKRLSVKDPRGNMIYEFMRIVEETRPRFFVMENVKGLVSAAVHHRPIARRKEGAERATEQLGSAFLQIRSDFGKLGYETVWEVVDAVYYGVPQFRERVLVIGSRDKEPVFIPQPTNFQRHQVPELRWVTLRKAIEDIEGCPGPGATFTPERAGLLDMVPPGGHWRALPKNLVQRAMGGAYKAGGGKVGFFRRLSYDQPSPTLGTSPTQKGTLLCHPAVTRPLSVAEYARIQQFPDRWKLPGSPVQAYKQIGNAVPVGLGQAIGQMLMSVIFNDHTIVTSRNRGTSTHNECFKLGQSI